MWGLSKKRVYLDWAAAAPVSRAAERAFVAALSYGGNPSAPYTEGREAKKLLEEARTTIARLAEVKTEGVVFTSGATEANALAILGTVRAKGTKGAHVLYHPAQHASVIGAIEMLKAEGAETEELDLENLQKQLRPETVLVCMDAVNSETGEIFDTLSVRRVLDTHSSRVLLFVDAAQAPMSLPITLAHFGADLVTLDAQKVGGVRGIGALLMRHRSLTPLMRGGRQEGGMRPGTESPALAKAFATALTEADHTHESFVLSSKHLRTKLIEQVEGIPNIVRNEGKRTVSHILNVSFIGRDTDYLVALLDKAGFAVSTKSACETNESGSRAVFAMTKDEALATSTLRISWGPEATEQDIDAFARALVHAVRFLDENAI